MVSFEFYQTYRTISYRPEVVHEDVENAENHNEHDRAPLRLESNDDHNTCHSTDEDDQYTPKAPLTGKDEADEQEDEKHSAGKLEVHFAVLLVQLRKTRGGKLLPYPAVRKDHDEPTHHREVTQEKVEVKNQSVAQCLCDDHANESADGVLAMLPGDNKDAASSHSNDVYDEKDVVDSPWHCGLLVSLRPHRVLGRVKSAL